MFVILGLINYILLRNMLSSFIGEIKCARLRSLYLGIRSYFLPTNYLNLITRKFDKRTNDVSVIRTRQFAYPLKKLKKQIPIDLTSLNTHIT